MSWTLEHILILVAIAGVLAKWLQSACKRAGVGKSSPAEEKKVEFGDPELTEHTRKVREDIHRKIEARRGQYAQSSPASSPMSETPPVIQLRECSREANMPAGRERGEMGNLLQQLTTVAEREKQKQHDKARREAEIRERQAALSQELEEVKFMHEAALHRTAFELTLGDQRIASARSARTGVIQDLGDRKTLCRAIVLREVLGKPVVLH